MSLQIRMAKARSMGLVRTDVYGRTAMHPAAAQYVFGRNKRMIAGDPGFFGDIWHGITGAVGGLLSGGPIGALKGAVGGFMSGGKAGGTTAATTGTKQGINVGPIVGDPAINQQGLGFTLPQMGGGSVGAGPGMGGGFNVGGPNGITIGGGAQMGGGAAAGFANTPQLGAGAGGAVMSGYHLNKHGYYTKGGHYVAPRSKQVKNRRRNPLNPRALHRSLARLHSAKHAIKALHLLPAPRRSSSSSPFKRKSRR